MLLCRGHSGITVSSFSSRMEVCGSSRSWPWKWSQIKGRTPHGFPSFFASPSALGVYNLLALKITSQNRIKRHWNLPDGNVPTWGLPNARRMPLLMVTADQGGVEPGTTGHRHRIAKWYIPWTPPKSKIRNPKSKIRNPKFPNPKSKIQTFSAGFWGFWILEFRFWILERYVAILFVEPPVAQFWILEFGFWILDFGVWILEFGFWILEFGFWILDFGFWISDFGFWILDFGFWSLEFGFRILDFGALCSNSFCADFGFWILDFGFWILDFGFWILDFGFWILDFGFRILDFGFRSLDFGFGFCSTFWTLHKIRILVTPTRVGGLFSVFDVICLEVKLRITFKSVECIVNGKKYVKV